MAVHPCPRCKKLIPAGLQYCAECKPLAMAQAEEVIERKIAFKRKKYNKEYNKKRDKNYLSFYRSKDWKNLSRSFIQSAEYKCQARLDGCTRLAVEVHHKEPIQTDAGWDKRFEWDNLEALCINCHNKRHDRFKKKKNDGIIDLKTIKM